MSTTNFNILGDLFFLFTLYQFMKLVESILQGDTVIATETVKDTSDSQLLSKIFKKGLFGGSSFMEDVHVRGLPPYLLQRGVGIAVIDSDESCLPIIRKLARACPVVWRPEG